LGETPRDLFVRTPGQQRAVAMAAALAEGFVDRAAEHDREGTFPYVNFAELRASGYPRLTVPKEFGGDGATLVETLLAQERLARGDGSTALGIGWHLALMGKLSETRAWPAHVYDRVMREVVERGALLNSVASEVETGSPSRGGRPTTTARPAPDSGWVLTGRKMYATISPVLNYALVSAGIDGQEGGGWFLVPMQTPGVQVVETWDSMSMRATGSHDLVLSDVRLPADALVEPFGKGRTCQVGTGGGAAWALHIPATYLGIARAARDYVLRYAWNRRPNTMPGPIADLPHIQAHLGQIEADLYGARCALFMVAQRWDEEPDQRHELVPLLGAAKVLATNTAVSVVDRAMRVAGIAGLSRSLPLERYYRDVRAGLHNPPMEDAALTALARAALKEVAQ
jgi:alkylation response protein AidB-like acyl-CoA dehydrogenase